MKPLFIVIIDRTGTSFSIAVDDISYYYGKNTGYCTIVLKTNGITIDTGYSYKEVIRRVWDTIQFV